jgi:hypothetical protein
MDHANWPARVKIPSVEVERINTFLSTEMLSQAGRIAMPIARIGGGPLWPTLRRYFNDINLRSSCHI